MGDGPPMWGLGGGHVIVGASVSRVTPKDFFGPFLAEFVRVGRGDLAVRVAGRGGFTCICLASQGL